METKQNYTFKQMIV